MQSGSYRAFWRWHFYAGVIVLPFLCWLAITGGLYLFKPEIERLVYRDWISLPAPRPPAQVSDVIASVERQTGGIVTQLERPADAGESWRMRVEAGGRARTAFVDPADGDVLGTAPDGGVMKTVRDLHSLAITGTIGNALIEIAAGWAIVLVVTGFVLWWPREGQRAIAARRPVRLRRFWRDLHASTGAVAGAIILFLAVTGMPWSVFWGGQVRKIVAEQGLGRPPAPGPEPWQAQHDGHGSAARDDHLPWALQERAGPKGQETGDIGIDRAIFIVEQRGLHGPYSVSMPAGPAQPYAASATVERASDARVIYVDAGSGDVLQDVGYVQFGQGIQAIEWGIATHQGQQYGAPNRWLMLFGCVSILLLAATAPVLWWKRRKQGSTVLPPMAADPKRARAAGSVAVVLAILYPLTGATILLVALLDRWLRRLLPDGVTAAADS
jgi:uncharacterized iron-regulated membrane protein